jgi:NTE family protein
MQKAMAPQNFELSLVLGGGNALGAYHLGVCQRLFELDLVPARIVGASIGAVTGAILAGNPPDRRLERLHEFWDLAAQIDTPLPGSTFQDARARQSQAHGLNALAFGRPGLFNARLPGAWSLLPGALPDRALQDHRAMAGTLERLIDFDLLNSAKLPLAILALDMENGQEIWFDTTEREIEPLHLLASTAFAPLFPPIEVDGRLLCDPGFANNVPLDCIFQHASGRPVLCLAVDLFSIDHGRPNTIDETLARVQDLAFASQTHRSIAALRRERELQRQVDPDLPPAILAHLAYRAPGHQRGLKSLDFSQTSLDERIEQGIADVNALLPRLAQAARDQALAYVSSAAAAS